MNLAFLLTILVVAAAAGLLRAELAEQPRLESVVCRNGAQLAAALADPGVGTALLPTDMVLKDDDWASLKTPVTVKRNFTIMGTAAERLVKLDFNFVRHKPVAVK
ncbi:hypothetical protein GPECTOR_15g306 [Gonium pectorale]|uniref:Uncharacterized protein n=1 Tax=Gonium pectorale TaxID=33097 RepID=A0A150GLC2_GONPE|nr:hypothetical protein GPECTOR_15g306 [Gonium pectorale]|eukprot:KXZ50623.1 hypothetical protein GPECTOR_15g306 [Gonium pectorale]